MPSFAKFIFADNEKPTISCPKSIKVNTDKGSATATDVTLPEATAEDNVGVGSVSSDAKSPYELGDTTVTFTATDAAENFDTCTVTVTVVGKFYVANIQIQIFIIKRQFL